MKKSEALGKIWDILYQHTDVDEEFLPDLSLIILEELEAHGMQPPFADLIYHQTWQDGGTGHGWEPEDHANDRAREQH